MIDRDTFRQAMSRLGAAVTLITTDGPAGRHGFTASAVCSVTDTPPTLLVCMNRSVSSHDAFLQNGVLGVSVLAGAHEALSGRFADKALTMTQRFDGAEWVAGGTGAPLLDGAAIAFDCTISSVTEIGTHSVLFCGIDNVRFGTTASHALLWFSRAYHHLPFAPAQT